MLWNWARKKFKKSDFEGRRLAAVDAGIPYHVAVIMDGNGRWANKRLMPRIAGHKEGMENVRHMTRFANDLGVGVLTLYAFSTENWKRSKEEVSYLMKLPEEFLDKFLPELIEQQVKVTTIGELAQVPASTLETIERAVAETKNNTGLNLNFAFNYGSRAEILLGVNQLIADVRAGKLTDEVDEAIFSSSLMTKDMPDPDLLIRTSGELRLSNFLLWQLAYTEFYFSDKYWPDFLEDDFLLAVEAFQLRSRRFGGRNNESGNGK